MIAQFDDTLSSKITEAKQGIPISIVTGFLGAGKTTLLNHLLRNKQGIKIAVFVNEFGSIDVDGAILSSFNDTEIVTLDNGCICCQVSENLHKGLSQLLLSNNNNNNTDHRNKFHHIVIETSGVADVAPLIDTLNISDIASQHLYLNVIITMIDVETFDRSCYESNTALSQIKHADIIVFNKIDLVDEQRLEFVMNELKSILNVDHVYTMYCSNGEIDTEVILSKSNNSIEEANSDSDSDSGSGSNTSFNHASHKTTSTIINNSRPHQQSLIHNPNEFDTISFTFDRPFHHLKFEDCVNDMRHDTSIIRGKGFIKLKGIHKHVLFHLVGKRTNPFETISIKKKSNNVGKSSKNTSTSAGINCQFPSQSTIVLIGRRLDGVYWKQRLENALA